MQRIVELELWSSPKQTLVAHDGKTIAKACSEATSVPHEVVLGLSFVPSEVDVELLATRLAVGESSIREFEQFCREQELPIEIGNPKSAAHFLAFSEGQPLAWLHFPEHTGKDMALLVHQWAARFGHVIRAGQGEPALSEPEVRALWEN